MKTVDVSVKIEESREDSDIEFIPIVRSGGCADIGFRQTMEDVYVCFDNFLHVCEYGLKNVGEGPIAFYGVFSYFYHVKFSSSNQNLVSKKC